MPEGADRHSSGGASRWLKLLGLIVLLLALLIVVVFVTSIAGPHGPWRHMRAEISLWGLVESPCP